MTNQVVFSHSADIDKSYVYMAAGSKNVGTYQLLYSDQQHYDIINQDYTITPATLTADINVSKTYDGTVAAPSDLTNTYTLAGIMPDDMVGLSITGASGEFAEANAGVDKTVTYTGLSLIGSDAGNYILDISAKGTIHKAQLTVSADSIADDITYGDTTLPNKFKYSLSGFVNGEDASLVSGTPVYSTQAWTGTKTGNSGIYHDLVVSGLGTLAAQNYDFTLQGDTTPGSVTITPANSTLTAYPVTLLAGGVLPTSFTGTASGYVNGDLPMEQPVFVWTGNGTSTIGAHEILGYLGGKSSGLYGTNYMLVQAPGNATALNIINRSIMDPVNQASGDLLHFHDGKIAHDEAGTTYTAPYSAWNAVSSDGSRGVLGLIEIHSTGTNILWEGIPALAAGTTTQLSYGTEVLPAIEIKNTDR